MENVLRQVARHRVRRAGKTRSLAFGLWSLAVSIRHRGFSAHATTVPTKSRFLFDRPSIGPRDIVPLPELTI
jgi:hypothetical protein